MLRPEDGDGRGGGFGDPKGRAPTDVAHDVRDGYVSPEAARSIYGYRGQL